MSEHQVKRKFLEEKQAFHNAMIAIPFFISQEPTSIIAIRKQNIRIQQNKIQQKLYYNGSKFVRTKIINFQNIEKSKKYYQQYITNHKQGKQNIDYCKTIDKYESILYYYGKIFVPWFQNKQIRDFLNDISQIVVYQGLFIEEHMKSTGNPLFKFLDHKILSLQSLYYRWRAYAYLQNDGQKRYKADAFKIIQNGIDWYPPIPSTIQRGILTQKQRRYFSNLISKLSRKKQNIQQAMVFAISCINCAVEIAVIIILEIFDKISEDFIKYFYLISDILFNTTTPDYRRLFSRIIPFIIYQYAKIKPNQTVNRQKEAKLKSQLKALIQIWQIKFIFDQNYTKGLLFLLNSSDDGKSKNINGIHSKLKIIGSLRDEEESQYQLQKICLDNGIPYFQNDKQESTRLINEYLWKHSKDEQKAPELREQIDGQPITQKDLAKIKAKQVKVITCQNLNIGMLLEKNWQTKSRVSQSNSVDHQ